MELLISEIVARNLYRDVNDAVHKAFTVTGVPSGKRQRGEFVYLLWNAPFQVFAIFFFIILEV